jgi:hypothetical protein
MSGQRAKPKYKRVHLPTKELFVTKLPSRSTRDHGPPMAGFPAEMNEGKVQLQNEITNV